MDKTAKVIIGISYVAVLVLGMVIGQTELVGDYNTRINDMLDRAENIESRAKELSMLADAKMAYTDKCLAGWYL